MKYHWPSRKRDFPDPKWKSCNEMMADLLADGVERNAIPLHHGQSTGKAKPATPRWTAADESRALAEIERSGKD